MLTSLSLKQTRNTASIHGILIICRCYRRRELQTLRCVILSRDSDTPVFVIDIFKGK